MSQSHDQTREPDAPGTTVNRPGRHFTVTPELPEDACGFSRYADLHEINRGGMGIILEAHDRQINRQVAIKMLTGPLTVSGNAFAKFLAEAQITGQLEHPNIVPVHELGLTPQGEMFFAMKRVDGESLAELLKQELPGASTMLPRLLGIFLKVCDAMAFAHDRGVLHRDLKPDNVMIGRFGEVLVMDWGVAKLTDVADSPDDSVDLSVAELTCQPSEQTAAGTILGTLPYMPPEQAAGELDRIDARSDIYSLGAVLYQILTLSAPFQQASMPEMIRAVRTGNIEPPSLRAPGRHVPRELEAVVRKAMAHDPADRYLSVTELQQEIQAYLDGRTLQSVRYNPLQRLAKVVGRHRTIFGSVAAMLLILASIGIHRSWRTRSTIDSQLAQADAAIRQGEYEQALEAYAQVLALVPDNRTAITGRAAVLRLKQAQQRDVVTRARRTVLERERTRHLRKLLALVASSSSGAGGDPTAPTIEDLVFSALSIQGGQTVPLLAQALAELTAKGRGQGKRAIWSSAERSMAIFCCRVLARLRTPGATDPLIGWMAVIWDPRLAVEAGQALCNTRDLRAYAPLQQARLRFGGNSRTWVQIRRLFKRIPEPEADPRDAIAYGTRALSRMDRGDFLGAIADYNQALRLLPDSARLYLNRGLVFYLQRNYNAGITDFSMAIQLNPRYAAAYHNRGGARRALGMLTESLSDHDQAIRLAPRKPTYWNSRGVTRLKQKDFDGAIRDHSKAIALNKHFTMAYIHRGKARLAVGNLAGALADYGHAISHEPKDSAGYTGRAAVRLKQGDTAGALHDINQAIRVRPEDDLPYLRRAEILRKTGHLAEAIEDCNRAIKYNPRYAGAYRIRAAIYRQTGNFAAAIKDYSIVVRLRPGRGYYWYQRGATYIKLKQYKRALADLNRAIKLSPKLAIAWFTRGSLHRHRRNHPAAVRDLERYLKLNPRTPNRKSIERSIKRMGG